MIGRLLELFDYDPIEGVLTWKRVWPHLLLMFVSTVLVAVKAEFHP